MMMEELEEIRVSINGEREGKMGCTQRLEGRDWMSTQEELF